jgi:hypothetical protein
MRTALVEEPIYPACLSPLSLFFLFDKSFLKLVHTDDSQHVHVSIASLHDSALAPASGLTRILAPLYLGDHELKSLEYVLVVASARLGPRAFELFGEGFAVFGCDLTLLGTEIGFVAHNDHGDPIDSLYVTGGQSLCLYSKEANAD